MGIVLAGGWEYWKNPFIEGREKSRGGSKSKLRPAQTVGFVAAARHQHRPGFIQVEFLGHGQ